LGPVWRLRLAPQVFEGEDVNMNEPLLPAAGHADKAATWHPACVVCASCNAKGLGVRFEAAADRSVRGTFQCDCCYQGYPGRLHGGVIAMLLDAAMTHCLFARGIEAVTARLSVQYRRAVKVGRVALVRGRLTEEQEPLYRLGAVLVQEGEVRASATGLFFKTEQSPPELGR
jgi:uncharacterized protein (TIGR00369 family)